MLQDLITILFASYNLTKLYIDRILDKIFQTLIGFIAGPYEYLIQAKIISYFTHNLFSMIPYQLYLP